MVRAPILLPPSNILLPSLIYLPTSPRCPFPLPTPPNSKSLRRPNPKTNSPPTTPPQEFLLQSSKSEVEAILAAAPSDTERISASLKSLFPHSTLSGASAAFTSALNITSVDNPGNKEVTDALFVVRDEIAAVIAKIMAFERFIALSNPPMEVSTRSARGAQR